MSTVFTGFIGPQLLPLRGPITTSRPRWVVHVSIVFLLLCSSLTSALQGATSQPDAPKILEAVAKKLWLQRADPAVSESSLKALEAWIAADPENPEALILFSRASYWFVYVLDTGGDKKTRMALLKRGMDAGVKAATLAPANPGGDFWAATNLGVYGKLKGIMESITSYDVIRAHLHKVESLDSRYFHGGVWRYYGRLVYEVPSTLRWMYGYSLADALTSFQKAIDIAPYFLNSYLWLAEAQLDSGDREAALRTLRSALKHRPDAVLELAPENQLYLGRIKALMMKRFPEASLHP